MCDTDCAPLARRSLLKAGVAGLAMGEIALQATSPAAAADAPPAGAPNAITPDQALARLMAGNARYVDNSRRNADFAAGRADRAAAQYPIAGILSCADARVAPEYVFDQQPGELFVTRVAGNFMTTDGLASLEYGVKFLGLPLIMVLGHAGCGAIAATIKVLKEHVSLPGHLPELIAGIKPAIDLAEKSKAADPLAAAIKMNVRYNVRRLQHARPIIAEAVAAGKVKVVGGYYEIATGAVTII
ncbi:carbonic anhydrase [Acidisoma sp. C75]